MSRTSQTRVAILSKPQNVDYRSLPFDGSFNIVEGAPIAQSSTGYAALPTGGSTSTQPILINYVDSSRSDVQSFQGNPFETTDTVAVPTGGLTGVVGQETMVGVLTADWGVAASAGQGVYVDGSSKKFTSKTITAADLYYGVVVGVWDGRVWFNFTTSPKVLLPA